MRNLIVSSLVVLSCFGLASCSDQNDKKDTTPRDFSNSKTTVLSELSAECASSYTAMETGINNFHFDEIDPKRSCINSSSDYSSQVFRFFTEKAKYASALSNSSIDLNNRLLAEASFPQASDLREYILGNLTNTKKIISYLKLVSKNLNFASSLDVLDEEKVIHSLKVDFRKRIKNHKNEVEKLLVVLPKFTNEDQVNQKLQDGTTLLNTIVQIGNLESVKLLINKGALLTIVDATGLDALHLAVEGRNNNMVRLLLENVIEINSLDFMSQTPLTAAIATGQFEIAETLLTYGANPNIKDYTEGTSLHALLSAHLPILKIKKGDDKGEYEQKIISMIEKLSLNDVDFSIEDSRGKRAYDIALEIGASDLILQKL